MTYKELMIASLSDLLEENETLLYPVYGTLRQGCQNWFGYFGLTESHLLIALLQGSRRQISWTARIPLDIREVRIKNAWFSTMYKVTVKFAEGKPFKALISKKVYRIDCQSNNLEGFISFLKKYGPGS